MAEFPIFEGTAQGAETTVRTSRIGPEPPEPKGTEAATRALYAIGAIADKQNAAWQRQLLQTGHEAMDAVIQQFRADADEKGYDKDWQENYKKLIAQNQKDIGKKLSDAGAAPMTVAQFGNNAQMLAFQHLPALSMQAVRLRNDLARGTFEAGLNNFAMGTFEGSPAEITAKIAQKHASIDQMAADHTFSAMQAANAHIQLDHTIADVHADHFVNADPARAMNYFADPANPDRMKDPILGKMPETMVRQKYQEAHARWEQQQNLGEQQYKAWKNNIRYGDNGPIAMIEGTAPKDVAKAEEWKRMGLINNGEWYSISGSTVGPGVGAGGVREAIDAITQSGRSNDPDTVQAAGMQWLVNPNYNKTEQKQVQLAYAKTLRDASAGRAHEVTLYRDNHRNAPFHTFLTYMGLTDSTMTRSDKRTWEKYKPQMDDISHGFDGQFDKAQTVPEMQGVADAENAALLEHLKNIDKSGDLRAPYATATPATIDKFKGGAAPTPSATPGAVTPGAADARGPRVMPPPAGTGAAMPAPGEGIGEAAETVPTGTPPGMPTPAAKPTTAKEFRDWLHSVGSGTAD